MRSSIEQGIEETTRKNFPGKIFPELVSYVPWIEYYVEGKDCKLIPVGAKIPWTPYKANQYVVISSI